MNLKSKVRNYCIVLKPGMSKDKFSGEEGEKGVYLRFNNHTFHVEDDATITFKGGKVRSIMELITKHPGFNIDFWIEEENPDKKVKSKEQEHIITNFEHGEFAGVINLKSKTQEVMDIAKEMAKEIAKENTKAIITELLKTGAITMTAPTSTSVESQEGDKVEDSTIISNDKQPSDFAERMKAAKAAKKAQKTPAN